MKVFRNIFIFFLFLGLSSSLIAQYGVLDESFGSGGIVVPIINESNDIAYDILQQSDGKIIIGGSSGLDFVLARFLIDGTPDITFGDAGVVITDYKGSYDEGLAIELQDDDKILIAGRSDEDISVLRYNDDGSLDISFGDDGIVTTDVAGDYDVANAMAIQDDGKIILAGSSDSSSIITLIRYNVDGSLDGTFGEGGISTIEFESGFDIAHDIEVLDSGKILIAGSTYVDIVLIRYNTNGLLDTSFGENGRVMTNLGANYEAGKSIAVQEDGKILIGGYTSAFLYDTYFALVRYNSNGNLDPTFNGTGVVTADIGPDLCRGNSVAVQADGKIILAGYMSEIGVALIRYNPDGSTDTSFSQDGIVTTTLGDDSEANQVILQGDGKILITGYVSMNDNLEMLVARYSSGLIVGVQAEPEFNPSMVVFPNPTIGESSLNFELEGARKLTLELISIEGTIQKVFFEKNPFFKGLHKYSFNLGDEFSSGVYYLCLKDDKGNMKHLQVIHL